MPSPPCNPAARSVMMSPNMLLVTITSNWRGSRTIWVQSASTYSAGRDLRIFSGYFLEHALPQAAGMGHGVGFVAHEHALARAAILLLVAFAIFEGIADHALHPFPRIDVFLYRNFIRRALLEDAAGIARRRLRCFHESPRNRCPWARLLSEDTSGIQQTHRTNVGIQVHLEAHAQ